MLANVAKYDELVISRNMRASDMRASSIAVQCLLSGMNIPQLLQYPANMFAVRWFTGERRSRKKSTQKLCFGRAVILLGWAGSLEHDTSRTGMEPAVICQQKIVLIAT